MGAKILEFPCQFVSAGCCLTCGVEILLPQGFHDQALKLREKRSFFCCNGHSQHFIGETEAERLQRELKKSRAETELAHEMRKRDLNDAGRKIAAARGEVTKIKNRVGNGVCPCCRRSFQNLMRHMKTKHPTYKDDA